MTEIIDRMMLSERRRNELCEELMTAAATYARKHHDRSEFLIAKRDDRDTYPWFELCLPDGMQLRVSVEIRAV